MAAPGRIVAYTAGAPTHQASRGSLAYDTINDIVYVNTDGATAWNSVGIAQTSLPFTFSFFTSSSPYIEKNTTSPAAVGNFTFDGTNVATPKKFVITGSRDGSSGTATARLQDVTNANTIAQIDFTAAAITSYTDTTLTNLPASSAIFEVQLFKSAGGASKVRLHSARLA